MRVPLLDLKLQYQKIKPDVLQAIHQVCEEQAFILGHHVEAFEHDVAKVLGASHAIGVSSGTDALLLALMAAGVKPGDEVITTPYSFFSTASSISRIGAVPVFVDIDPVTYNLDPSKLEAALTPKAKGVLPVHLYGRPADMDPILSLARDEDLVVIEDGAQAIGAVWQGRKVGTIGHAGALSFFPSKNLGGFGDGGMVLTNDPAIAAAVRRLRVHGSERRYEHIEIGINGRLDALQAAVLRVKLSHLDEWTQARRRNAHRYVTLFAEAGLRELLGLPTIESNDGHVFNQFVIRSKRRDELKAFLASRDIGSEIYYPIPLHLQPCYRSLGYGEGDLPEAERAARETLALPVYPELTEVQQAFVVETIAQFYQS
ncbi:MAG TPA: DegT/DnrJ/EryC1/StrS family aminotransferase [Methylomirabilota bacterium]|nr:DegT/DnrJ/EryC1/StrS family aminotransferase [Methylomirabilota bacterium]